MSDLSDKLTQIKSQKDNNLTPGNLKSGVTLLGVTGALPDTSVISVTTPNTDLDDYQTTGKYWFNYANTPSNKPSYVENAAGYLEVMCPEGITAYTLQRWTVYDKGTIWERQKVNNTWNSWKVVSKQPKILWEDSGGSYMDGSQRATLSEPISAQQSGIILLFQPYRSGAPTNWGWYTHFFPKAIISLVAAGYGQGITIPDCDSGIQAGKYLYFYDNYIEGNDKNGQTTTMFGQAVDNRNIVLTKVIGI